MADDPEYDDDNPPPRAKKKSGGGKWLLIILGVLGVACLTCCGGIVFAVLNYNPISTVPAVVTQKTQEIAPITVSEGWTPTMSMNMGVFNMVMYAADGKADDGLLMIIEVTGDQASGKQLADQQMKAQSGNQQMKVEETTKRTFKIRDKDYEFAFSKGKSKSGEEMHMVMGEIPSSKPGKVVVLMVIQKGDKYDEDSIVEMIESIK